MKHTATTAISKERIPRFIRTDVLMLKDKKDTRLLYVEKFKTIFSPERNKQIYTGLIVCYWQDTKDYKKDVFAEDSLVLAYKG